MRKFLDISVYVYTRIDKHTNKKEKLYLLDSALCVSVKSAYSSECILKFTQGGDV